MTQPHLALPVDAAHPPHPAPPLPPVIDSDASGNGWSLRSLVDDLIPWLSSLCLNLILVVGLALFALPLMERTTDRISIAAVQDIESEESETLHTFALVASDTASSTAMEVQAVTADFSEQMLDVRGSEVRNDNSLVEQLERRKEYGSPLPDRGMLEMPVNLPMAAPPAPARAIGTVVSVESAVDGLGRQMGKLLENGDLLVVWLFDKSISLRDDRLRISQHLPLVYADLAAKHQTNVRSKDRKNPNPRFLNTLVAYGWGVHPVVPPTTYTDGICEKIKDLPIDPTGKENVFDAIRQSVLTFRNNDVYKRWQVMFVVWTDESGDDTLMLEPLIYLCQQANVRVSIVGPSAVLGCQEGRHGWEIPAPHPYAGTTLFLPVLKGPDTAFPERLRWPYWWETKMPAWHQSPPTRERFEGWYGGYHLDTMTSGFAPYAYTRLALETGGEMTIFDRPIDRGPFMAQDILQYSPDYRKASVILDELRYFPMRQAIIKAVGVTHGYALVGELDRDDGDPFIEAAARPWVKIPGHAARHPPKDFYYLREGVIPTVLRSCGLSVRADQETAERALAPLCAAGMDGQYLLDQSPRWRAWYDLTKGRLLAQSVRYAEYRYHCLIAAEEKVDKKHNCLEIRPGPCEIDATEVVLRAQEAEKLLQRCVENNPNTPWAYLAQRELDHPFGITHRTYYEKPPRARSTRGSSSKPLRIPRL
jgi:hypothetical protein